MSVLAPLHHAPFRLLLAGRTINAVGNAFAPIALAFAVLDHTGSAADLGLVVGARTVANVAFLIFGGVLADRLPKNLLMVGSNLAAALTQGAVAALVLTHTETIPLLIGLAARKALAEHAADLAVGLAAINGMVAALALPASASILPLTVPQDVWQQANALNRIFLNSAAIFGAPAAGLVVAAVGPGWGITVDAATFLISALCFLAIRLPDPARPVAADEAGSRPHILADLRTGWSEFRSRTWLWVVVAGFCLTNAAWAGALFVLGPVVADDTFGRRAWGFVLAAQTAGMLVGGVVALRLRLRRLLFFGVACCLPMSVPVFLLGAYPHVWSLLAGGFLAGLAVEQFGIAWETTMQEHVPSGRSPTRPAVS